MTPFQAASLQHRTVYLADIGMDTASWAGANRIHLADARVRRMERSYNDFLYGRRARAIVCVFRVLVSAA
jgi:hypothetical protein